MLIPVVAACLVFTLPLQAPVLAKAALGRGAIVTGRPEDLGFSPERLARIHDAVQRHFDAKSVAGAVTMVVRNGRLAHLEGRFSSLASMSKPVTAVAAMVARVSAGGNSVRNRTKRL
jgi:hypothetical protein